MSITSWSYDNRDVSHTRDFWSELLPATAKVSSRSWKITSKNWVLHIDRVLQVSLIIDNGKFLILQIRYQSPKRKMGPFIPLSPSFFCNGHVSWVIRFLENGVEQSISIHFHNVISGTSKLDKGLEWNRSRWSRQAWDETTGVGWKKTLKEARLIWRLVLAHLYQQERHRRPRQAALALVSTVMAIWQKLEQKDTKWVP